MPQVSPRVQGSVWSRHLFLPKTGGKSLARTPLRRQGYHGSSPHQLAMEPTLAGHTRLALLGTEQTAGIELADVCVCVYADALAFLCVIWKFILSRHHSEIFWEILIHLSFSFEELQFGITFRLPTRILFCS